MAGGVGERCCQARLEDVGFATAPAWEGVFVDWERGSVLSVYVGDLWASIWLLLGSFGLWASYLASYWLTWLLMGFVLTSLGLLYLASY